MSHDEGSRNPKDADAGPDDGTASLRDTAPGIPEMELSRTLPTGAAFHATLRIPALAPPSGRPGSASEVAKRATAPLQFGLGASLPPVASELVPGASRSTDPFATTRREFGEPKLSPREKARRNVLTHTLQMPLVVNAVQPTEAPRNGSLPGWSSMHRVGSPAAATPRGSEPSTDSADVPQAASEERRPEPAYARPPSYREPAPSRPKAPGALNDSSSWTALRTGDYERVTLPGGAMRVPELSAREWMFIGLLACASAATLYSLLIDDVVTVQHEVEAATTMESGHVVEPAPLGSADEGAADSPARSLAAVGDTTEIVSEPSSAEIVLGGAVIGNTPAKVTRGSGGIDYLLRKQGYEPQLVRITPNSPESVTITLHPK